MEQRIRVEPLPYKTRQKTFLLLLLIFVVSLPFLYLYATGYRFDIQRPTTIVSTGGMYVAVDRTGAEIYIDNELVRETRTFRKAFYAQSLDIGTHRVHVQKEGHHTWVKELPVSKHLVTEAQAFNMPLVPQVKVISPWKSATGTTVVTTSLLIASTTNETIATTTKITKAFLQDPEYVTIRNYFGTTSTSTKESAAAQIKEILLRTGTTTTDESKDVATSTVISGGVKLYEQGDDVFAIWIGPFEQMPYYYCAADFPPYSGTSTSTVEEVLTSLTDVPEKNTQINSKNEPVAESVLLHPVQTIPKDIACERTIQIDRKWQEVSAFTFFPGSTDFVLMALEDGVYVVEVDNRSWQNVQPLIMGEDLKLHVENNAVYVFDGALIYEVVIKTE